ncbi:MAG: PAS domain-containing protein, partial [Betaproteobacteria bacterium]|nr:PAS domain-containing protein [Betaproteobacteria bacterium]
MKDYARLVQILDSLPGLVGYVDLDLRIVYANKLIEVWYQRPLSQLVGMQLNTLFSKEHYKTVETLLQSVLSGKEVDEQREIYYPDGRTRQVHLNYIPDLNGDSVLGYFFLVQDVTEYHQAQLGLKKANEDLDQRVINSTSELAKRNTELLNENRAREQSEERYRIVSELMSDLIYVYEVDEEGSMHLTWYTGRLSKEFFPQRQQRHFRLWRPIVHKDDIHILDRRMESLLNNKNSVDEFRVIDADQNTRWIRVYGRPMYDHKQKRVTRITVAAQDITETRDAQNALDQQRIRLRQALDSMSDGFMLFDSDHRLVEYNKQVVGMFPLSGQSLLQGKSFREIISTSVLEGEVLCGDELPAQWIERRLASFPDSQSSHEAELIDGRWVRATDRRTTDGGVVSIRTDITDRKRAEEVRHRQEAELAQVLRRASMGEMASALAHELSQPLAVIVNYANGLLRRIDTETVSATDLENALRQIRDAAQRSKEIIKHVRDFVNLSRPIIQRESVSSIITEVNQLLHGSIKRNNIGMDISIPFDDIGILANRIEIEQVIFNLLKNSIDSLISSKTRKPQINIKAKLSGKTTVVILISDNGDGIDRDLADDIFNPYITTK